MDATKMTVRVPRELLERAKRYARENDTTLTGLIITYLDNLDVKDDPLSDAPIVKRLAGSLSQDVSVDDYHRYLGDKYGTSN